MQGILDYLTSAKMLTNVVVVALGVVLWIVLNKVTHRHLERAAAFDRQNVKRETAISTALSIARYALLTLIVLTLLQTNGVNVSSLIAGLGIASAVVGLALQDLLKDIIMGSNIISNHVFSVGDVVRYGSVEGVVISFTVKATKIRDIRTNDVLTVCNRNISEITVISDRLDLIVSTSYQADPVNVRAILIALCTELAALPNAEDCTLLGTEDLAGSSVNYRLRLIAPPETHPALRRAALEKLYARMREEGLSIPYQQLDIHHI